MKGDIDMSAVFGEELVAISISDAEAVVITGEEKYVEIVVVENIKQDQLALSFHILIIQFMI